MASAGGTWVKSPNFNVSGKYVFVPMQKAGKAKVWMSGVGDTVMKDGIVQGGLIAYKDSAGSWSIAHVGSGLTVATGFANQASAVGAMEELSHMQKWSGDSANVVKVAQDLEAQGYSYKDVANKFKGMTAKQAKEAMLTAKDLQAKQKGIVKPKAANPEETSYKPSFKGDEAYKDNFAQNMYGTKTVDGKELPLSIVNNTGVIHNPDGSYTVYNKAGDTYTTWSAKSAYEAAVKAGNGQGLKTELVPESFKKAYNDGEHVETLPGGVAVKQLANGKYVTKELGGTVDGQDSYMVWDTKGQAQDYAKMLSDLNLKNQGVAQTAAATTTTPAPKTAADVGAAPAVPQGVAKFTAEAKTWSTGTKSLDMGEGVTVIQKADGKILVKDMVGNKANWHEAKSIDEAMNTASDIVALKSPSTVTLPKAQAPTATPKSVANNGTAPNDVDVAYFDANKKPLKVSYVGGKEGTADGVLIEAGHGITFNANNNKYHLINEQGKTIGKFDSPQQAQKHLQNELKGYQTVASNPSYSLAADVYGSTANANKVFGKYFENHAGSLTSAEVKSLSSYQGSGHQSINGALWSGKSTPHAKTIDSAMKKSPGLPHETLLYRKNSTSSAFGAMVQNLKVGDIYHSKAYDSTSIANDVWHGSATIIYKAPKGTKGFFMNSKGYPSSHPGEYEYLLPRNMKWKVVDKTGGDYSPTITVEFYSEG